ncbi:MAG: hypothetical protein J6B72_01175 [Clostridia bacterium]|nr:hypothetical protein [Clostridia bacterium]
MSRKNALDVAQKYFTQKKTSAIDIISILLMIVGAVIFVFAWGFGYIGIPMIIVGVVLKIFSNSSKIKDSEYDQIVDKLISAHNINADKKIVMTVYDSTIAPVVIGKDKKLRSNRLYVSAFEFQKDTCNIDVYEFNVCDKSMTQNKYSLSATKAFSITEKNGLIGNKKMTYFSFDGVDIPIDVASSDSDKIINSFSK